MCQNLPELRPGVYERGLRLRLPLPPGHGELPAAGLGWQPSISLWTEGRKQELSQDGNRVAVVMGTGVGKGPLCLSQPPWSEKVSELILVRSDKNIRT